MSKETERFPTPKISFEEPRANYTDIGTIRRCAATDMKPENGLQLISGLPLREFLALETENVEFPIFSLWSHLQ